MEKTQRDVLKAWADQIKSKIENKITDILKLNSILLANFTIHKLHGEEISNYVQNGEYAEALDYFTDLNFPACSKSFTNICDALALVGNPYLCETMEKIARERGLMNISCSPRIPEASKQNVDWYNVISTPYRGHVLILNNSFENVKGKQRNGCEKDVQALERVFGDLNYKVNTRRDLTCDEMVQEITDFAENDCHRDCGAAGVVIMSHGGDDGMIHDDKNAPIHENKLLFPLKNGQSQLVGKPVFVLIQACRGGQQMPGVVTDLTHVLHDGAGNGKDCVTPTGQLENMQDIVIVYSCLPTYLSRRDAKNGSIFIQTFCEVLKQHGNEKDFDEMFTLVAEKDGAKQLEFNVFSAVLPQKRSFLKKKFYLSTSAF